MLNKDAKEVSSCGSPSSRANAQLIAYSKEQARFGCPEAESSLWGLWNEQNENVSHKSEDQMTSQDNKPKCTSMWRDESVPAFSTSMWRYESVPAFSTSMWRYERVGTNGTEWEHLRILM